MPERLKLSSPDILSYNNCPAQYYFRRVGYVTEYNPADQYEFTNKCIDRAMIITLQAYYNGQESRENLDRRLLEETVAFMRQGSHQEQNAWLAEVFQAYYFGAQYRRMERFIYQVDLPRNELAGEVLTVDRGEYDLCEPAPFYADGRIISLIVSGNFNSKSHRWINNIQEIQAPYYLLTKNNYPVTSIETYKVSDFYVQKHKLPTMEQQASFEFSADLAARSILRKDYYPRPSFRCIGCKQNHLCQDFILGGLSPEVT